MTIIEFTHIFLPQLAADYVIGKLPLHGLVDVDTWRQIFPDTVSSTDVHFHWYQIQLTCNKLQDGTLLFTFILPSPTKAGEPKFAALRFNPESNRNQVQYYVLQRPHVIDDAWDIYSVSLSPDEQDIDLRFESKITGTDSLRNFVYSVQRLPFTFAEPLPEKESETWLNWVTRKLKEAVSGQD